MIVCPVCGCQQRKAEVCVQCHAPLFARRVEKPEPEADEVSYDDLSQPSFSAEISMPAPEIKKSFSLPPTTPPRKLSSLSSDPAAQINRILVTTTQRIEGKRIAKYFGLLHSEAFIASGGVAAPATEAEQRRRFKEAVSEAIGALKTQAFQAKANAVVATSFNYQRVDADTILLSACGTAVLVRDS